MTSSTITETDTELLERFVDQGDEGAFAKLVQRHGPMVLGVCRQILRQEDDAEDAFQATFLVLSRKASSIRAAEALPNWLYGVARRLATRSRFAIARRHAREVELVDPPSPQLTPAGTFDDLAPTLHEEIGRLPDKYRLPFILCYLEGKTNEEAARQLGCPSGTVFSRLARARERLRARLTRRGLALSAGVLTTTLATLTQKARAAAPHQLSTTTVRRALRFGAGTPSAAADIPPEIRALAEWGVKSLARPPWQIALVVLLCLGTLGGGLLLGLYLASEIPLIDRLQGTWSVKSMSLNGNPAPFLFLQAKLTFQDNRMTLANSSGTVRINTEKEPIQIDWVRPDGIGRGILELRGNTLTIAVGQPRPTDFTPGPGKSVMVFERLNP